MAYTAFTYPGHEQEDAALRLYWADLRVKALAHEPEVDDRGRSFHWELCAYCDQPYKSFPTAHRGGVICNRCYFGR
jgi:hypothetical protein